MKILIIEDDQVLRDVINQVVHDEGYEAICPSTYAEGIKLLQNEKFNVVIIESSPNENLWCQIKPDGKSELFRCTDGQGSTVDSQLTNLRILLMTLEHTPEFIFVTRVGSQEEVEYAIDSGAVDYIQVPVSLTKNGIEINPDGIRERLIKAFNYAIRIANGAFFTGLDLDGIVGQSWKMKRALLRLAQAARSDENVLIIGETGTGKRNFAEKIHQNSRWKNEQLIVFDCRSKTISEADFELFCDRKIFSKIGEAQTVTLLMYGIDNLNESVQGKLFWHLQNNIKNDSVSSKSRKLFRLICTANADIENSIANGDFRNDLYYEVSTFTINLPPLRERKEDIPELVRSWLTNYCEMLEDQDAVNVSSEFIGVLKGYDWPGNLLEFNNALNFAVTKSENGKTLEIVYLPPNIQAIGMKSQVSNMRDRDQEFWKEVWRFLESDEKPHSKSDNRNTKKNNDAKAILEEHTISDHKGINSSECRKKPHDPKSCFLFYQEGDFWRIGPLESAVLFNELIGMKQLSFLLRHPEKKFSPAEVYNAGMDFPVDVEKKFVAEECTNDKYFQIVREMGKKDLMKALTKLKNPEDHDFEDLEAEILRKELITLVNQTLRDRQGFGDSARANKQRSNVTRSIRRAIEKITKTVPTLKHYLNDLTIKTGNKMYYDPNPYNLPDHSHDWIFSQSELPKDLPK